MGSNKGVPMADLTLLDKRLPSLGLSRTISGKEGLGEVDSICWIGSIKNKLSIVIQPLLPARSRAAYVATSSLLAF